MQRDKSPKRTATNNWWNFTLNNFNDDDYEAIRALFHDKKNKINYIVVGKEVGESGTPHLQGFIAFDVRKQRKTVTTLLGGHAYVSPVSVTPSKAAEYCKKDGKFFEKGSLPLEEKRQGARLDLSAIKDKLDAGESTWQIAKESQQGFATISRAHKFFLGYETAVDAPRSFQTQVYVFYGEPGTYKSFAAHQFADLYTVVRPRGKGDGVWFDGYQPNQHRAALFDDFYGWIPYNNLLELTDRYGCRVQVKGSTIQWKPQSLLFTSNTSPERWYDYGEHMQLPAIQRRLAHVFEHTRVQAGNDALGLSVGDILVRVEKGLAECHPLFKHMRKVRDGEYHLKLEDGHAAFEATQMDTDTQIEFTRHALVQDAQEEEEPDTPDHIAHWRSSGTVGGTGTDNWQIGKSPQDPYEISSSNSMSSDEKD